MDFILAHPAFILWVMGVGGAALVGLVLYIWKEHNVRNTEDRDRENAAVESLNKALAAAFEKMENKLERAVQAMEDTASSLGKSLTGKIETIEARLDVRIDDVEKKQTIHCAAITKNAEQVKGVIAVCRERARHCPMFAMGGGLEHFHTRMSEAEMPRTHKRMTDDEVEDGSDA